MKQTTGQTLPLPLGTLYTLGYSASGAVRLVEELVALDVTIVDIRSQPTSIRSLWEQVTLSAWLGKYYWHLPALGNTTYAHRSQPIILADPERGLPKLIAHLQRGGPWHSCACVPSWSVVTAA